MGDRGGGDGGSAVMGGGGGAFVGSGGVSERKCCRLLGVIRLFYVLISCFYFLYHFGSIFKMLQGFKEKIPVLLSAISVSGVFVVPRVVTETFFKGCFCNSKVKFFFIICNILYISSTHYFWGQAFIL